MQQRVPSLLELSMAQLRTPEAREITSFEMGPGGRGELSPELIGEVQEMELGQLRARGRIPRETYDVFPLVNAVKKQRKPPGIIDGAKLAQLRGTAIRIRVDDSDNLPFWLEIDLPLDRLQKWLGLQGIKMTWCPVDEESTPEKMLV